MTTIAANLEMMAADSMCSDSFADFPVTKIRIQDGAIWGGSGTLVGITRFFEWLERGRPRRPPKHEKGEYFEALQLDARGIWVWSNAYIPFRVERPFHAIGAGGQAAIALMMHAGMDPAQAVDASCDVVPSACARPVDAYSLADVPRPKRKPKP